MADRERLYGLEYEVLSSVHDVTRFDCDDADLNDFIMRDACRYQEKRMSTTFVFVEPEGDEVVAFVTLCCDNLTLTEEEREEEDIDSTFPVPAVKIARLAVNKEWQGRGLGSEIVRFAVGLAAEMSTSMVGCRFVTVDAYPDKVEWYVGRRFKRNDDRRYRRQTQRTQNVSMRLDLLDIDD